MSSILSTQENNNIKKQNSILYQPIVKNKHSIEVLRLCFVLNLAYQLMTIPVVVPYFSKTKNKLQSSAITISNNSLMKHLS